MTIITIEQRQSLVSFVTRLLTANLPSCTRTAARLVSEYELWAEFPQFKRF